MLRERGEVVFEVINREGVIVDGVRTLKRIVGVVVGVVEGKDEGVAVVNVAVDHSQRGRQKEVTFQRLVANHNHGTQRPKDLSRPPFLMARSATNAAVLDTGRGTVHN